MQSGISLYLTIIIMTILLAIVLGLTTIFLSQVVMLREMGHSVVALYSAEAGIERVMYAIRKGGFSLPPDEPCGESGGFADCWAGNPSYIIKIKNYATDAGGNLTSAAIVSKGTYSGVSRAIEISW